MRKMRARVIKKFTSAEGMTILIALLFFMMCAVVGSIILTAATAASGRLSNLRDEEKGYFAASSAAEFLRDSIEGTTFQISQTDGQKPVYSVNGYEVTVPQSDALLNLLLNAKADTPVEYTMNVTPNATGAASGSSAAPEPMEATIEMRHSDDYQITAAITTADGYKLTLVLPSEVDVQVYTKEVTPTEVPPTGVPPATGESVVSASGEPAVETITTTVTTVSWSGGRITASA